MLHIKEFIEFFKVDKDYEYANKTIKYFTSENFMQNLYSYLNVEQFKAANVNLRDIVYIIIFTLNNHNNELLGTFLHKTFLHFFSGLNKSSKIQIDYIDCCKIIAKHKHIVIKESFYEDENLAYFKLFCNEIESINLKGTSIKTLRKKAYKNLLSII